MLDGVKLFNFVTGKFASPFHISPILTLVLLHVFSFTGFSSDSDQAFFLVVGTGSIKTFTHSTFLSHLRTCLCIIGIKPQRYAGHSFRRGGASFAYEAGLPIDMIKLIGDCKSDAVYCILQCLLKCDSIPTMF